METMEITGYGCHVTWDGQTLRAKGTNKATHIALMGDDAGAYGELVLPAGSFRVEKFKTANIAINGNLVLVANDTGRKYQLHFRRKHNEDFEALAEALGVTV